MTQPRVVAPRLPTPHTPSGGHKSGLLPDDVVADQVRRLKLFAIVSGGLWAMGLLMDSVVFSLTIGARANRTTMVIESLGVLTAALVYLYVCYSARAARSKADSIT